MSVLAVAESIERRAGDIISGFGWFNPTVGIVLDKIKTEKEWSEMLYYRNLLENHNHVRTAPESAVHAAVLALARAKLFELDGRSPHGYLRDVDEFLTGGGL